MNADLPDGMVPVPLALSRTQVALLIDERRLWAAQYLEVWSSTVDDRFTQTASTIAGQYGIAAGWQYAHWVDSTPGLLIVTSYLSALGHDWASAYDQDDDEWVVWCDADFFPEPSLPEPAGDATIYTLRVVD